jgi:hypothetical protein
MWIGSIRLVVPTGAPGGSGSRAVEPPSGAVVPVVLAARRAGGVAAAPGPPGSPRRDRVSRTYDYLRLDRVSDRTPLLLHDAGGHLLPYPEYGVEYSQGLYGHLRVRLLTDPRTARLAGGRDDVRPPAAPPVVGPRRIAWVEDEDWSFLGTWGCGIPLSHHAVRQPVAV